MKNDRLHVAVKNRPLVNAVVHLMNRKTSLRNKRVDWPDDA